MTPTHPRAAGRKPHSKGPAAPSPAAPGAAVPETRAAVPETGTAAPGIKLRKAAEALAKGGALTAALANQAGFSTPAALTVALKKEYLATPDLLLTLGRRQPYDLAYALGAGGGFNVPETLAYLGRDTHNLAERVRGRAYTRFYPLAGRQVPLTLTFGDKACRVEASGRLAVGLRVELHRRLAIFLGLNQSVSGFRRAVKDHPVMGVLARKFPGLRIPQVPSLWEGLCWAIIGQQINLAFAYKLRNRLIALGNGIDGEISAGPGAGLDKGEETRGERGGKFHPPYPFPTPAQVLGIPEEAWRPAQFSRQKTVYLKELARAFEEGRLVEETLQTMPDEEAREALISIKGLGPWSAAYGLLRALGRVDALPVGDAGLRASLKLHFGLETLPTPAEQEALMEDFRPYRGLATYCLWKALGQSRQE